MIDKSSSAPKMKNSSSAPALNKTSARPKTATITSTQAHLDKELTGLPGRLSLTTNETKKYFGDGARSGFFDRYKWLDKHINIAQVNTLTPVEKLYYRGD